MYQFLSKILLIPFFFLEWYFIYNTFFILSIAKCLSWNISADAEAHLVSDREYFSFLNRQLIVARLSGEVI